MWLRMKWFRSLLEDLLAIETLLIVLINDETELNMYRRAMATFSFLPLISIGVVSPTKLVRFGFDVASPMLWSSELLPSPRSLILAGCTPGLH